MAILRVDGTLTIPGMVAVLGLFAALFGAWYDLSGRTDLLAHQIQEYRRGQLETISAVQNLQTGQALLAQRVGVLEKRLARWRETDGNGEPR